MGPAPQRPGLNCPSRDRLLCAWPGMRLERDLPSVENQHDG